MKKILSLVLAVAMLSTLAFAADGSLGTSSVNPTPGDKIVGHSSDFEAADGTALSIPVGDFTSSNFSIAKKSFTKGASLVKSVAINDDDEVVEIKLNQDYALLAPGAAKANNLVIDELAVKAKKSVGNATKGKTYTYDTDNNNAGFKVGYVEVPLVFDTDPMDYAGDGDQIYKFKKNSATGTAYDLASYDGADVYFEGRVYDGDKVYVKVSNGVGDDQKAVLKAYPDADLRFVTITTNGLPANNDIQVLADEDEFVYEIVDGKVVKSNLKWSEDDYAWVGKFRTNKAYVLSDVELKAVADAGETTGNPETGANDVVGIAAALAVVSLIAAGAVSLKK